MEYSLLILLAHMCACYQELMIDIVLKLR